MNERPVKKVRFTEDALRNERSRSPPQNATFAFESSAGSGERDFINHPLEIGSQSLYNDSSAVPLEPFNLNDEKLEGHFDDDGTFVWHAQKRVVETDSWLASLDETKDELSIPNKRKSDVLEEESSKSVNQSYDAAEDQLKCIRLLAEVLQPGESPGGALRRLKQESSHPTKMKQPKGTASQDVQNKGNRAPVQRDAIAMHAEGLASFEAVTEACDTLLQNGHNVFSTSREDILKLHSAQPSPSQEDRFWKFRWRTNPAEQHGPYGGEQMQEWEKANFFAEASAEVQETTADGNAVDGLWCSPHDVHFVTGDRESDPDSPREEGTGPLSSDEEDLAGDAATCRTIDHESDDDDVCAAES